MTWCMTRGRPGVPTRRLWPTASATSRPTHVRASGTAETAARTRASEQAGSSAGTQAGNVGIPSPVPTGKRRSSRGAMTLWPSATAGAIRNRTTRNVSFRRRVASAPLTPAPGLWDGGDCCPSTCRGEALYKCGTFGYTCIDPAAAAVELVEEDDESSAAEADGKPIEAPVSPPAPSSGDDDGPWRRKKSPRGAAGQPQEKPYDVAILVSLVVFLACGALAAFSVSVDRLVSVLRPSGGREPPEATYYAKVEASDKVDRWRAEKGDKKPFTLSPRSAR